MKYLIKKRQYYVSKEGRKKSYTTLLKHARIFNTLEEAKKNCCGNERVVNYSDEI